MDIDRKKFLSEAHEFMARWNCLPDGKVFYTHSSLLWPVTASGEKLMLKIANPDDDEAHAADMLRYYNGHGTVRLVKNHVHIQLLERICDDTDKPTLEQMAVTGKADAATRIICDVIGQLHAVPLPEKPLNNLIPFRRRSDEMRERIDEGRVKPADLPMFQTAYDLCDELIAETLDQQRPLHGDIHHGNILFSAARGWLAIDPKGIMGPRVYEYANSLCNPFAATDIVVTPAHMERHASIMAEQAGLDKGLLLQFTFLHALQCAAWGAPGPWQSHCLACGRTAAHLAKIKLA